MRRLQLTSFGEASTVLEVCTAVAPHLSADELLVQVEAAPINRFDSC